MIDGKRNLHWLSDKTLLLSETAHSATITAKILGLVMASTLRLGLFVQFTLRLRLLVRLGHVLNLPLFDALAFFWLQIFYKVR